MNWFESEENQDKEDQGSEDNRLRQVPRQPSAPPQVIEDLEDDFVDAIYDWVGRVKARSPQFRGDLLHVSKLHELCPRIAVFEEVYPDVDTSWTPAASLQLIFDFGTATHDWWQNKYFGPMGWLWGDWQCTRCREVTKAKTMPDYPCRACEWKKTSKADSPECKSECRWPGGFYGEDRNCALCNRWGSWTYLEPRIFDKELGLIGSCDGILYPNSKYLPINEKIALEAKTKNKEQFDKLVEPEWKHRLQINTYMHYLGLNYGVILYIHKGDYDEKRGNKPRAFLVEYDPGLTKRALDAAREWRKAKETKTLGHRLCYSKNSWQAKKCPFYDVCYDREIDDKVKKIYEERAVE